MKRDLLVNIMLCLSLLVVLSLIYGCDSADRAQRIETEVRMKEANSVLGLPAISNWTEKRLLKQLYELRDQEGLATFTYTQALDGSLRFLCNSIGYGMPFSAQYSNPQRVARQAYSLPQPEPNGLFMPEGLSATWVLCVDPEGVPRPVYLEPVIVVSPFRFVHPFDD